MGVEVCCRLMGVQPMARALTFCGLRKGPVFKGVLSSFREWPASCIPRRAWHLQL